MHLYTNEINHTDGRIEFGGKFHNATAARISALKSIALGDGTLTEGTDTRDVYGDGEPVDFVQMMIDGREYRKIYRNTGDETTTAIADPLTLRELVEVYEHAAAGIRAGFARVADALGELNGAIALGGSGVGLGDNAGNVDWKDPARPLRELRRRTWRVLIERSQIRKVMSVKAWEQFDKDLQREDPPEITIENVEGIFANFRAEAPEMLRDAVKEVFEMLRPRGAWRETFKTNSEFEIGERVVLSGFVQVGYGSKWDVNYHRSQDLIALENVFNAVDGKIHNAADGYTSKLQGAIEALPLTGACHGETDLFEFRGHRKGTLHLRFKRRDLVAKLNAIAGGKNIKPVGAESVRERQARERAERKAAEVV